jgi:hypothetical protein
MFELSQILQKLIDMLPYALVGIFNGFGTAIGVYFAQRSLLKHLDNIKGVIKNGTRTIEK